MLVTVISKPVPRLRHPSDRRPRYCAAAETDANPRAGALHAMQRLLAGPLLPIQAQSSGGAAADEDSCERSTFKVVARRTMILTTVQNQAISARMALIVGGTTFDRLFSGVRFDEVDGDVLFVFAKDEETAAEIEDNFCLQISIVATGILGREVGIVLVLPKQLDFDATAHLSARTRTERSQSRQTQQSGLSQARHPTYPLAGGELDRRSLARSCLTQK